MVPFVFQFPTCFSVGALGAFVTTTIILTSPLRFGPLHDSGSLNASSISGFSDLLRNRQGHGGGLRAEGKFDIHHLFVHRMLTRESVVPPEEPAFDLRGLRYM